MQKKLSIKSISYKITQLFPAGIISWLTVKIATCDVVWFKRLLIQWFARHYKVNMAEALESDLKNYPNLDDFFVRALKPEARPITNPNAIVSPVDGVIMQCGKITDGEKLQVKGYDFNVQSLIGDESRDFIDGDFVILYLAPKDYHRVHQPFAGKLEKMQVFPGTLFSVQPKVIACTRDVLTRNERVVNLFTTSFGPMAVVLVGAIIVGSIEMQWEGVVARGGKSVGPTVYDYHERNIIVSQGGEIGRFHFGSTVILLFPKNVVQLNAISGMPVKMGQVLGKAINRKINN